MGKKKLLEKIKEYNTIIIHGHIRPDGDCYGAQFGLKDIIKQSFPRKEVYVVGGISDYVSFVGTPDSVSDDKFEGALSIVVDTATHDRVSDQRFTLAKEVFKIDHHVENEKSFYADYYWVNDLLPSASQMIAMFFKTYHKELKLSFLGAQAMYVGIVTDTGRFRYRGVSRQTHEMAGLLLDYGVDVEEIDNHLSIETMQTIKLKGEVLSNFKVSEGGFIYFKMTREVINRYGISDETAASMVNVLSGIEGYPVWALFIEYPDEIRVRLRSRGPEIETLARKYNGGGHQKAAGCRIESYDDIEAFAKDVDALLR
ncbi:MAG: bifunctional oligoribonuclease/PAP phosphatase NrnA [Acholeplasmataceae bacterium]